MLIKSAMFNPAVLVLSQPNSQIIKERRWKEVTAIFNFPSTATNASFVLRKYYQSLLRDYEQIYFFRSQGWCHVSADLLLKHSFCLDSMCFSSWIWLLLNDLLQILGRAHPQMRCQLQGQHSHRQTFNQLFSNQELMLLCCLKVLSFSALVLCLAQNCCLILNTFYLKCQHFWLVVGSLGDCCNCQFFFLTLLYVKHFLVIKDIFMRDDELIINFFS